MAEAVIKKLPAPVVTGGKPLMETIGERKTIREFKAQNVDDQTLSEILWVAFGISHDGKRTDSYGHESAEPQGICCQK